MQAPHQRRPKTPEFTNNNGQESFRPEPALGSGSSAFSKQQVEVVVVRPSS